MGTARADLALKAACERCGGRSGLYATSCRHTTLCGDCGRDVARARGRCAACAAPVTRLVREYDVRVKTAPEKAHSIGRFTTGLPPFSETRRAGNRWSLRRDGPQGRQLTGNAREKYYNRRPWMLEDETGEHQYQGQLEGPQSSTATYYFLTLEGKEISAVPVSSWYNFSKTAQYKQLTLEEAEEKMNRRGSSASGYERWMMKAATNGAAAFSGGAKRLDDGNGGETGGAHLKKGSRNEDVNQSDKGEDNEEGGAARKNRHGLSTKGMEEDDEEAGKDRDFDLDDEIEKGDDWEHEETFTDDDEALDIDREEMPDLADPEAAPPEIKQSQEDNENELGAGGNLSKSGQELKKLLRRAAGQNESDDDEDKDTDEDEHPSEELAPKQLIEPKSEPGGSNPAKQTPSPHPKNTTLAHISTQKRTPWDDDGSGSDGAASKKIKIEPETKTLSIKVETPSSLETTSKGSHSASTTNPSPVTEEEIRAALRALGPVWSRDLAARFRPRLTTRAERDEFTKTVGKLSHVCREQGRALLVLRQEYK